MELWEGPGPGPCLKYQQTGTGFLAIYLPPVYQSLLIKSFDTPWYYHHHGLLWGWSSQSNISCRNFNMNLNTKQKKNSHQTWTTICLFAEDPSCLTANTNMIPYGTSRLRFAECPYCGCAVYNFFSELQSSKIDRAASTDWANPPSLKTQVRHSSRPFSVHAPRWCNNFPRLSKHLSHYLSSNRDWRPLQLELKQALNQRNLLMKNLVRSFLVY